MSCKLPPTPEASVELAPRRTAKMSHDDCLDLGPAAMPSPPPPANISTEYAMVTVFDSSLPSPTSPTCGPLNNQVTAKTTRSKQTKSRKMPAMKPPPPRRNPIIQMQPKKDVSDTESPAAVTASAPAAKGTKRKAAAIAKSKKAGQLDEKLKARKSTHSEIERRRRLKINKQFDLLRDLVPACQNQDMHKLTILEATTEYIQYLLDSIKEVKGSYDDSRSHLTPIPSSASSATSSNHSRQLSPPAQYHNIDDDNHEMQIHGQSDDDDQEDEVVEPEPEPEVEEEEDQNESEYMDVDMHSNQLTSVSMSTNPSPFLLPRDYSEEILQYRPQTQLSDHDATEALLLLSDRHDKLVRIETGLKPLTVREMLS